MLPRMALRTEGPAWGVVVAAGRSERMGGIDKVFASLLGRPIVVWSLSAFRECEAIDRIVVVAAQASLQRMRALVREWRMTKVADVVPGGPRRRDSVAAGIAAARDAAVVAVHDAARPLVTPALIAQGVALAREGGAAICGVPARDTVKDVQGDPPVVTATRDRARTWLAQTPQVFSRDLLLAAHARDGADATDDAAIVEAAGHPVRVYEGAVWNLKITTPEDLVVAEALLRERYRNM
jgi:2-C-methyl-D-erythritol 4-phosphate cytidylyltransferase